MKDLTLFQTESDLHQKSDIGMYYCGKRIKTLNHTYGPEIRNYYLFVLINEGRATFFHKSGEMKLKNHDMLVMCPGERIHYVANTPWSIQWVGIYGQTVENYMREISVNGDNPIIHIENYHEMSQVLEELYQTSKSRTAYSRCKQVELLYKFFSILLEKNQEQSNYDVADSVKTIIDYNFGREITLQEISDTLHLNSAYLSRKFMQKYGIAPKDYLIEKRIAHAKRLLRESDASVMEISASVGYVDQFYFSRIFKKKEGIPPLAYRKKSNK